MFKHASIGFQSYGKAINLLFTRELWWFLLFPIALNIVFFSAGILGIDTLSDYIQNYLETLVRFNGDEFVGASYLKPYAGYLSGFASGFVWILLKFVFFFVFATFGGYLVIVFLAPVFAVLSEKTAQMLTGNQYPFSADQLMHDMVRGVLIATRNMLIELGYILAIFVLGFFIPILGGIIGTVFLFFIAAYFYGFSFIDYTLERQRMSVKQSIRFMRTHKGLAIANGMVFSFFMLIPFCGVSLAGFAAILSVIAATVATHQIIDLKKSKTQANTSALDERKED